MYMYIYLLFMTSTGLDVRQCMDRRRLQEAFFQYALLRVASRYPKHIAVDKLYLHEGLSDTLLNVTALFHKVFTEKYAGQQSHYTAHAFMSL